MDARGYVRPQQGESLGHLLALVHFWANADPTMAAAATAAVKACRTIVGWCCTGGCRLSCKAARRSAGVDECDAQAFQRMGGREAGGGMRAAAQVVC